MNHSRFLVPVMGVFCLATLAPLMARAQDVRSVRQSFQSSGTLSWGDRKQSVQRVRVELDEDGDARLKFDGQTRDAGWGWRAGDWNNWDAKQEIDGVWLRDARGIIVDLRSGLGGQTVVGSARIPLADELGRFRPSEMTLSGRVVRHPWDTLDLSGRLVFDSWEGGNTTGGGNTGDPIYNNRLDEFSTIKRGDGRFLDGGQTSDITRANVQLNRDGTARIVLSGDREYTFGGRWRQTSASRIELRIDTMASQTDRRVFDVPLPEADSDSLGGGEIQLDGTRLVSLRLSGTRDNRDFDASFEPQTAVWNGGGGGGVWDGNVGGGTWNGGWNGTPGWNGGHGDNGHGGWNGGGNGNWDGNGGNKPHPKPQPEPESNLHGAWSGWTGEGGSEHKGNLPAPSPQPPSQEQRSRPYRPHSPDPEAKATPRGVIPSPPSQAPSPAPAPASPPTPAPAPAPQPAPAPAPEPTQSTPPAPPQQSRTDDSSTDNSDSSSHEDSGNEKGRPRTRVGKPR